MKSDKLDMSPLKKEEELKELLKETEETFETGVRQVDRSFGTVDMWNRQKRQRTSLQMRRWLN